MQCCSFSAERGSKRAPSSRTGLPPRPERCAGLECGCPDTECGRDARTLFPTDTCQEVSTHENWSCVCRSASIERECQKKTHGACDGDNSILTHARCCLSRTTRAGAFLHTCWCLPASAQPTGGQRARREPGGEEGATARKTECNATAASQCARCWLRLPHRLPTSVQLG